MPFCCCGRSPGEEPNPDLEVPFHEEADQSHTIRGCDPEPIAAEARCRKRSRCNAELTAFGSSEYAKACSAAFGDSLRRSISRQKPIFIPCSPNWRNGQLIHSARDISDGGIAVALAQAAFGHNIGASGRAGAVADGPSALRPLRGARLDRHRQRRAEPGRSQLRNWPDHFGYHAARIGTTGGDRLEISVYGDAVYFRATWRKFENPGLNLWKRPSMAR